ncbi:SLC13 family permease [Aquibacillus sediminis]|uniref:SLC13 family permease n=1 Tax=Aquibacillus sediminis TaxID=2574734 RepID=UPI0024830D3A|nr:SLC13 family permease [Aquibacillus sediminis]
MGSHDVYTSRDSPSELIFSFWQNPIAYLIMSSWLIARAIEKTGLGKRIALYVLAPFLKSYRMLLTAIYGLGIMMSLFIPHPFARAFIIIAVVKSLFEHISVSGKDKASIGIAVFLSSSISSFVFLTADSALNITLLELMSMDMTWGEWFTIMGIPSILFHILVIITHLVVFPTSENWKNNKIDLQTLKGKMGGLNTAELVSIVWLSIGILLWTTDFIHGIHPGWVATGIVILMTIPGKPQVLSSGDLNAIKIDILLFISAMLAIGKVSQTTGLSEFLANKLLSFIPDSHTIVIALSLTLFGIILHLITGSAFSMVSILVPIVLSFMEQTSVLPIIGAMIIYLAAKAQWFFPHQVMDILIGTGKETGGYTQKEVIRLGTAMIIPLILGVIGIYLPWWTLTLGN